MSDGEHRWLYWTVGAVVLVLLVIGLITYNGKKDDQQAKDKAQQVTQKLQAAGLPVPAKQEQLTRVFGTDGGAVCDNPGNALGRALLYDGLVNGASFVGRRPVIADTDVLKGEAIILETYCPDKLAEYRDKISDLKLDDTIKR